LLFKVGRCTGLIPLLQASATFSVTFCAFRPQCAAGRLARLPTFAAAAALALAAAACTQQEVDAVFESAKKAQKGWARTPLWRRAELLHRVAAVMRENAQPIADVLVKEVAKPATDAFTEVIRSADLISYTAEEGVRYFGEVRRRRRRPLQPCRCERRAPGQRPGASCPLHGCEPAREAWQEGPG
jgi:hypothetical protein